MSTKSLFQPLSRAGTSPPDCLDIILNGQVLQVPRCSSIAASLLAAGVLRFRNSPVSGAARAPYCMMGVCFECLLEIDGVPNRQGCLVNVVAGMRIRTQDDLPGLPADDQHFAESLALVMEAAHGG
jgi:hypothetical protein